MASAELTSTLAAAGQGDQNAVAMLDTWKAQNYGNYCVGLAHQLTSGPATVHQVAAIALKNALHAEDFDMVRAKIATWKSLDAATRAQVKEQLLLAMNISDKTKTAYFTAMAASEIAAVELPHAQWPELVGTLMDRVVSDSTPNEIKLAALDCLGYSAERMAALEQVSGLDQPPLANSVVDKMLTTIVNGCQQTHNDALRLAALKALRNALCFCRKNMETKTERDFIMQGICEATASPNADLCSMALECLETVAQFYYVLLADYMLIIFQVTTETLRNPHRPGFCKTKAVEFWNTVCANELELLEEEQDVQESGSALDRPPCPKYVFNAKDSYVPLLLELLTQQDEEIEDDLANSPSATAAVGLELVGQVVKNDVIRLVIPFVEANVTHANWRLRGAAMVAFGCILEGVTTEAIGHYVVAVVPVLVQALEDAHAVVKDAATHTVSSICKFQIAALQLEQIHLMIKGLMLKLTEPHVQLASHATTAIFNIAQSIREYSTADATTNVLSGPMHPLLAALLVAVDREDGAEANLRIGATSAISELITSGAPDCLAIYKEFLPVIVDRIQKLLKLSPLTSEDREEMESSISQYCGIVQMLFQRLSPEDVGALADTCMEGVMEILNRSIAACLEDAFLVIAGVASCLDERFNKYLSHIIPHVIQGLRSFQAQELCIISVGVVVDICTAVGPAIQPYCDQIVEALKTTLADSHVPRDVKPVVISCFGDIALAITGAYEPYVEVSAMLLMQASRQCMTSSDDDDMLSFINDLRLAILEAYSGIVIGLADGNKLHLFMASVQSIFQFLEYLSTPESDKDDRVLAKAVALVGDIVQQLQSNYKDSIKAAVNQAWLGNLLMEASVSSDEARQNAIWTRSICEEVMRS